jgi:hypothetical protein
VHQDSWVRMNPIYPHCGGPMDLPEARLCPYCGALLASDTISQPKTQTKQLSRRAVNVSLILFEVFALSAVITGGFAVQDTVEFTLAPSLCATSIEDAGSVLAAYSMSDSTTLTNLVARGKAFSLPEGVQLHIVSRGDRISRVRIESGTHTNEHCWIPAGLIGDRTSTELRGRRRPIRRRG